MELVKVFETGHMGIVNPESAIAHKYLDGLKGIEIGAAAYQPFGVDALNVSTGDTKDREYYKNVQLAVCGNYVTVDREAESHDLPFASGSLDFVVASHVLEHISNPIATLVEWDRVVKSGGILFLIVPKRLERYGDQDREITPYQWYEKAYSEDWHVDQAYKHMWDRPKAPHDRKRGHVWVFSLESLIGLVEYCNTWYRVSWRLVEAHETDDTTGEGHLAVFRRTEW